MIDAIYVSVEKDEGIFEIQIDPTNKNICELLGCRRFVAGTVYINNVPYMLYREEKSQSKVISAVIQNTEKDIVILGDIMISNYDVDRPTSLSRDDFQNIINQAMSGRKSETINSIFLLIEVF